MPQTAQEQLVLELINRARLDPLAEAARQGIALNEGLAPGTISAAAKQPLAPNAQITNAARGHSQHMLNVDQFAHEGIGDGTPGSRMTAAGYAFTSFGLGENIAFVGTTGTIDPTASAIDNHDNLFIDKGIAGRGHRVGMLDADFREVGIGNIIGVFTSQGNNFNTAMLTQDFAVGNGNVFVTGVAINDTDNDNFYDVGEGRGSVLVSVGSSGTGLGNDFTEAAGGYGIGFASRTSPVNVSFSGGGLAAPVTVTLANVTQNVKVDLLGTNEVLSSGSTTMVSGVVTLGLLGVANIFGFGNAAANVIIGNRGGNFLAGAAGNDSLFGAAGNDIIVGGQGRDFMTGGPGNDTFRFMTLTDSGKTPGARDVITDILKTAASGIDKIDLFAIDAMTDAGTANDTFSFVAAPGPLFSAQGQIRWFQENPTGMANDKTIISINTDTVLTTAEMQIELRGLVTLAQSDFVL